MVWNHEDDWQCDECGECFTVYISRALSGAIYLTCDQCGNTTDIKELGASK